MENVTPPGALIRENTVGNGTVLKCCSQWNRTEQNALFKLEHIRFIVSVQIHIHEYGLVKKEETKKENKKGKWKKKKAEVVLIC